MVKLASKERSSLTDPVSDMPAHSGVKGDNSGDGSSQRIKRHTFVRPSSYTAVLDVILERYTICHLYHRGATISSIGVAFLIFDTMGPTLNQRFSVFSENAEVKFL